MQHAPPAQNLACGAKCLATKAFCLLSLRANKRKPLLPGVSIILLFQQLLGYADALRPAGFFDFVNGVKQQELLHIVVAFQNGRRKGLFRAVVS